jgi:hypothetical protein
VQGREAELIETNPVELCLIPIVIMALPVVFLLVVGKTFADRRAPGERYEPDPEPWQGPLRLTRRDPAQGVPLNYVDLHAAEQKVKFEYLADWQAQQKPIKPSSGWRTMNGGDIGPEWKN